MTQGPNHETVRWRFGVGEWLGLATVLLSLFGAWVDMRVRHEVAVEALKRVEFQTTKIGDDHELRLRILESERLRLEAR